MAAPPPTRTPSRPPITSRIRSSFEKRRQNSNEVQSPNYTNGNSPFFTQDADSLRKAIDEAINSETFLNAIAANLAKLIKPSIKSALDTIQPVVEAVYNHEVLLRKTNHSVENILERLEVNTDAHAHQRESVVEPFDKEVGDAPAADAEPETRAVEEQEIIPPVEDVPPPIPERAVRTPSPSQDFAQFRRLQDESNARTATALSELSSSVEASNGKITEALQGISNIQAGLGQTKENVDGLKVFSEHSTTTAAVIQAQLDQLQADIGQVIDAIGADLGKNVHALHEKAATWDSSILSSHTTKLDALATDLGAFKGHSDTMEKIESISTELKGLKGSVEAGISSNTACFTSLGSQITNVLNTIEGHTNTLGEIKDKGADPEILAALQQSNDSHATNTAALSEIKERSLSAASAPVSAPEVGNAEATAALQDLKADLASLKENIAAGLTANNENVTGLGTKIDSVFSAVQAHKASDSSPEILAAVQQSNESHASHSAVLAGLKSRGAEPAPAAEFGNLAALEAQVGSIVSVLDAHTAALDEIKTAGSSHATALDEVKSISSAPPTIDNSALESQITALASTLDTHTSALDELKTASNTHATTLGEVKALSGDRAPIDNSALENQINVLSATLDAHTSALDEIKSASSAHTTALEGVRSSIDSAPAPADNTAFETQIAALATTLDTHSSALDELRSTGGSHSAALDEIKGASTSHATTLDEIKAVSSSHAAALDEVKSLSGPPAPIDNTALESQIAALATTLDTHSSALEELKSTGGSHSAAWDEIKAASTSHATALEEVKSLHSAAAPADVDLSGLESQIAALSATLETHSAALVEIKSTGGLHSASLDEIKSNSTSHAAALESVRSLASEPAPAPAADVGHLAALEAQVGAVVATLALHTSALEELKSEHGSHSAAVISALDSHTSALDEIKGSTSSHATALERARSIGETSSATDKSNLAASQAQIAAIVATLGTHTAVLDHIKASRDSASTEVVPATKNETLEGHFSTIIETLDAHTNLLNEIKDDVSAEILTTLHELGQSQAQHGDMLAEIREADVSDEILTLLHAHSESQASHSAILGQVHEGVQALNESHTAHGAALDEIKSKSVEPAPATEGSTNGALEAKIDGIASTLESHKAALSSIQESHASHAEVLDEIRDATAICNESHADHALAFSELKELSSESNEAHSSHHVALADIKEATAASNKAHASHTAALAELKAIQPATVPDASRSDSPDIAGLETQVNSIITALERQTATLSSLMDSASDKSILEATLESNDILISHTALLNTIKDNSSHDDILSNLKDLKTLVEESKSGIDEHSNMVRDIRSDTKETHSSLTSAIAGLALGGAAGAGAGALVEHESDNTSAEILTEVKAVKKKVDLVVSQIEINHTTTTTSITTLSDELKAEIDATGTQITESITNMDATLKEIDLKPITSSVEQTGQVIKDLSSQIGNLESHIQDNTSKVNEIHHGVHLNDTGISQLREHAGTREVASETVPEGMWFGSGSPNAKRLPHPFEHSSPSAVVEEPEHQQGEEREGSVLEAIPEVDTPLDESPVKDRFKSEARGPAIPEEEIIPVQDEVVHEDETADVEPEVFEAVHGDKSIEAPREHAHKVVDVPAAESAESRHGDVHETLDEAVHEPISHDAEPEPEHVVEPKREPSDEVSEVPAEPEPEHVEETKRGIPESHTAKPEELEEDEPAPKILHDDQEAVPEADTPVNHAEKASEEILPDPHEEDEANEVVPIPHTEAHEHLHDVATVDEKVTLKSEVHGEPVLSEEPTEPEVHHETVASEEPAEPEIHDEAVPIDGATEPEVHHEPVASEEVAEPTLEPEVPREVSEPEPVEERIEVAPEHKAHEAAEPEHARELEPADEPTEPEVHHQAVDTHEAVEPAPKLEVAHEVSEPEPEPVLEHHEQEPEAEPAEEPTEAAPEHESSHEVAEPEPEVHHQVVEVEEPGQPAPEPEVAHEVSEPEPEPVLEHHGQEPEAEPIEEPTNVAPEHEAPHEVTEPEAEPFVEPTEPEPHHQVLEISEPAAVSEHDQKPEAEPIEEPAEITPENESAHEVAKGKPEPEPVLEHHKQEAEPEPVEEATEAAPEHESTRNVAETKPVLEHPEPEPEPEPEQVLGKHEPEPEPANEPTEPTPEPETAHELPNPDPLEEHHRFPKPTHLHEAADGHDLPPASHTEPEPHPVDPDEED